MAKLSPTTAVLGMILFGTACSLLAKLIYSVSAPTIYGGSGHYEKPWLQVFAMFAGMSVCILLDLPRPRPTSEQTPLMHHDQSPPAPHTSVWIISIPTLFDLFGTACGTTGLLYTTVSVYQMLRGAMLIWTALLSILFLRTKLSRFNYTGIACCVVGIALVGLANVWAEDNPRSQSDTLFGIIIILIGQILQAAQVVMEEHLLRGLEMSSVRVVAWEGLFGILHCLLWVFPLIYFIPGRDHGHLEDTLDAFYMLTHSWQVAAIIFTDMTMMLFYNICGMEVTDSLSAVHRVVIETLRTLCVWLADLFIFYILTDGTLGENWNRYSYLQLFGFTLLVLGTVIYNYEQLAADYEKRQKAKVAAQLPIITPPTIPPPPDYHAIAEPPKPAKAPVPAVAMLIDEGEEEEEHVGSFYGHTVGSVAHSPFLVAASATPTSLGSLRYRAAFARSH